MSRVKYWGTKTHRIWKTMKSRCLNPNFPAYQYYGARGITVCERWQKYPNFLADMGECPEGLSLDRIDNSKGYEPSNCRWADRRTQSLNVRRIRMITFRGETLCIQDWSRRLGIPRPTIDRRLATGLSVEEALTLPRYGFKRRRIA